MASLTAFCKKHELPKSTVHRFLKEANFDTSNGLSEEAEQAVLKEFKPEAAIQEPVVIVETGNHCTALATPEVGRSTVSLEQFRSDDTEALMYEDPGAVADAALVMMDQLIQGMGEDIKQREERLKKAREAQSKVAGKVQELTLEQRLYRDRARDLDTAQTSETTALQDAVAALQALGKPQGD